ncbi:phosphatase PAP2 family protein [Paenibacillus faecalis]|uniref:phosphatase PAP2 family protein n=1 Tax=Paenibacillus faecalis TaxID=2079532 RepID=UPI001F3B23EB|nr:phosphatase PAP2 family protein [Paenibacillus faecalis]
MSNRCTYSNTHIRRYWIISVVSFLVFAGIAAVVMSEQEYGFDSFVTELVRGFEQPAVTDIAMGLTFIGSKGPIIIICIFICALLYVFSLKREITFFLTVILGSALLNILLKTLFRRNRPDVKRLVEAIGYSFPSGHAMAAFSLYGILIYLLWKHVKTLSLKALIFIVFGAMILGIGLSRIYLGVHYPSDVLGGFFASCSWLMLSIGIYEYLGSRSV